MDLTMLGRALCRFGGLLTDLISKLMGPNGKEWVAALKRFLRKENPCWEAAVSVAKHLLDLDADPFIPKRWRGVAENGHRKMGKNVLLERRGDDLYLNGKKIVFHLSEFQMNRKVIEGHKLREELSGKEVLNANVLDYLFAHTKLIPDSWKFDENGNHRFIYFWGTVYYDSGDNLCVRYLYWRDDEWDWGCDLFESDWNSLRPAAVLED